MKAITKGSLAGCLVHLDAGSTNRLARQNLIPEHAKLPTILICTRCYTQGNPAEMYAASMSSISTWGRYTSLRLSTVKISKKQHEVLCKRLKAKKVILHTIHLGVGGSMYTSHTLNHLNELGLDAQNQLSHVGCERNNVQAVCECPESIRDGVVSEEQ